MKSIGIVRHLHYRKFVAHLKVMNLRCVADNCGNLIPVACKQELRRLDLWVSTFF